jgi:hypothetical protein
MKFSLTIFLFFLSYSFFSQVRIEGIAPAYVGKKVQVFGIQDYFSYKDTLIGEGIVQQDSTFHIDCLIQKTQKIVIKSNKNQGFIYVEPNKTYAINLPDRDPFNAYRPQGNQIEIGFRSLDSLDLNYKIIAFDNWVTEFLAAYFNRKTTTTPEFASKLDTFKINVEKYYATDTNSFFKTYVRYSIASLDDIQFIGARNRYEKYNFYIKDFPIMYDNETYMKYIALFYKNILGRFPTDLNTKIYQSILRSSPSLLSKALSEELTLKNPKIRELILIKSLSEAYNGSEYPKTNIISMLDSISAKPIYASNSILAKNLLARLTELAPGVKAPEFNLAQMGQDSISLKKFAGKYLYIQFIDPNFEESEKHCELLKPMYLKYKNYIEFVSIMDDSKHLSKKQNTFYASLPWKKYVLPHTHSIYSRYNIKSYPSYVLIDDLGIIYSYPALGPIPNGEYENIEKYFFSIKRKIDTELLNKDKNAMDNIYNDD